MHPPDRPHRAGAERPGGRGHVVGDLLGTRLDRGEPGSEEADRVRIEQHEHRPGRDGSGEIEADFFQSGVDGDDGQQHPDTDDRAGNRVPECRRPRGELGHARSAEAACVGEQRREDQAHERGDGHELQAVPQVPGELVEQRRAAGAALFGDRPQEQLEGGAEEGDEDHERARGRRRGRPSPGQPARSHSAVRAAGLSEPGPPATDAFEPDGEHGEREDDEREFAGRVAVVRSSPDPEDADRHGVDAEVLHGREVGERFHHHHGGTRRDRRANEREHDSPHRFGGSGTERPCREVGARRLVAKRGAGEQKHVRIQDEAERDDRAAERFDVGEPGVAPEPFAPLVLDRTGATSRRDGQVTEDVAGHRQRQDQQPAERLRPGKSVGGHQPRQPDPEHGAADRDADEQQRRRPDLTGESGPPLLAPHVGLRSEHARHQHEDRDRDGDRREDRGRRPAEPVPPRTWARFVRRQRHRLSVDTTVSRTPPRP